MKRGIILLVLIVFLVSTPVNAFSFTDFFEDIGESITGFVTLMFETKESKSSESKSSESKSSESKSKSESSESKSESKSESSESKSESSESKTEGEDKVTQEVSEEDAGVGNLTDVDNLNVYRGVPEKDIMELAKSIGISNKEARQIVENTKDLDEARKVGYEVKLRKEIHEIEESEGSNSGLELLKLTEERGKEILDEFNQGNIDMGLEIINSIKYKHEKIELIEEAKLLVDKKETIVIGGNIFNLENDKWKKQGIFGESNVNEEYGDILDNVLLNKKIMDGKIQTKLTNIDLMTNPKLIKPAGFFEKIILGIFFDNVETCSDGIQNQNEETIDCGGVCESCMRCDVSDIVTYLFSARENDLSVMEIQDNLESMLPGCTLSRVVGSFDDSSDIVDDEIAYNEYGCYDTDPDNDIDLIGEIILRDSYCNNCFDQGYPIETVNGELIYLQMDCADSPDDFNQIPFEWVCTNDLGYVIGSGISSCDYIGEIDNFNVYSDGEV